MSGSGVEYYITEKYKLTGELDRERDGIAEDGQDTMMYEEKENNVDIKTGRWWQEHSIGLQKRLPIGNGNMFSNPGEPDHISFTRPSVKTPASFRVVRGGEGHVIFFLPR